MNKARTKTLAFLAAFAFTLLLGACSPPEPERETTTAQDEKQPQTTQPIAELRKGPIAVQPARPESDAVATHGIMAEQAAGTRARAADRFASAPGIRLPDRPVDRENYAHFDDNPVRRAAEHPVSTFSIDVDTGSYSNIRRMLRAGRLPPQDAVRVEELINYFSYDYPVPESDATPFSIDVEQAATPWNPATRLVQIGIQGYRPAPAEIPASNLVFLIDISGSMNSDDKLPLLKNALKMLTRQLDADDRIAMVVYAGATGVVLESTPGDRHAKITSALDQLAAGGATNGGAGIELAYAQAEQGFIEGGVNRVILATDGDFNVGTVDFEALKDLAERKRETGVAITTLGFGGGNYNDHLMEQLADAGNGNYAYIDTLSEARKVLVDEMNATLMTIAKDVKIQLEFNPAVVAEYRLIGYENRILAREDFNNDAVDAGDIGAGHTVTALYEVALADAGGERIDPLRYGDESSSTVPATRVEGRSRELGFLKLRYKAPGRDVSELIEQPVERDPDEAMSDNLAFAAAVAAFGQHLRGGKYLEGFGIGEIHALAAGAKGADPFGYRGEFLQLVRLAEGFRVAGK
ncbi:MAG: VWA domain-containing protein [Wenzhouxiangellaceae bacterium]|nr:VWA domain-containing protein [Wenzhouxiangellaceae bacterium]MBS3824042.1 VWA domain-containing protein [Wenzhouxiangellaceae bacterium]